MSGSPRINGSRTFRNLRSVVDEALTVPGNRNSGAIPAVSHRTTQERADGKLQHRRLVLGLRNVRAYTPVSERLIRTRLRRGHHPLHGW